MIDNTMVLQTRAVLLRPLRQEDLPEFSQMTADPRMWTYFTADLSNPEELRKWVNDAVAQTQSGTRLAFSIIDQASGQIAGSSSLMNISLRDKRIEIGSTWLGREFQGKGINDSAKYLMMNYCFEVLKFERVEAKTDVLNLPARKALKRVGMTEEGILRSHTLMTHNRRRDTIYYSILKTEWTDLKIRNNWI